MDQLFLGHTASQLRTCFEIQNLVAKRLQLLPLPREIALFQHSDFAGERDGVRGNRISKHVLRSKKEPTIGEAITAAWLEKFRELSDRPDILGATGRAEVR